MTRSRTERITGLETRKIPSGHPSWFIFSALEGETEIARAAAATENDALSRLVEVIYKRRSRQVMEEQGWRDWHTGKIEPLQIDHITPRARGRDDRRGNLRAVGADTHARIHRNEKLNPHPMVLESIRKYGWDWDPVNGRIVPVESNVGQEAP